VKDVVGDYRLVWVAILTGALLLGFGVGAGSAGAGKGRHTLTFYSFANGAQYLNNGDDRGRGIKNNPFDARQLKLRPAVHDVGDGPFPGDVAVFTLTLYANASLKKNIGSGAYTCYYNYAEHALCIAYYRLTGGPGGSGTLVASGPVDFNNTDRFSLVVTGGTDAYRAARGELSAAPTGTAERVNVLLLG
jgi:hypothetical protein